MSHSYVELELYQVSGQRWSTLKTVRVADGPLAARYRFIKNASWEGGISVAVPLRLLLRSVLLQCCVLL